MLKTQDQDDRVGVAARLAEALSVRGMKKAVAQEADVSDQAVTGWIRTGRIGKESLSAVEKISGYSSRYILFNELPRLVKDMTLINQTQRAGEAAPPLADTMPPEVKDLARRMAEALSDGRMTTDGMDLMRRMLDQITKDNRGAPREEQKTARD